MKIAITKATAGAGKWSHEGWANAFKAIGHEVIDITHNHSEIENHQIDLLINSTSHPSEQLIRWRKNNPQAKVAMNVLAWTDLDIGGIHNAGVQATPNNTQYAKDMKADIVFAQYGKKWRELLLNKWHKEGFKLSSMMMAVDSIVYEGYIQQYRTYQYDYIFCGGFWMYKSQTIVPWLMPIIQKYRKSSLLIGKGWPIATDIDRQESAINKLYGIAKVCPNVHEPHSHFGYDIVERCFKVPYCGGLLVSDYVEEMIDEGFKSEVNCFLAKTPSEYQDFIDEVISAPEEYTYIAENGQKFISKNHTYIHRVQQLLKDIYE